MRFFSGCFHVVTVWQILFLMSNDVLFVSFAVTETPGGTQIVSASLNIYGNNVTNRGEYLPSGADKSWIDYGNGDRTTYLPAGHLIMFYVFVNNISTFGKPDAYIRLQIWRETDGSIYENLLVWERRVRVTVPAVTGILYTVSTALPIDSNCILWGHSSVSQRCFLQIWHPPTPRNANDVRPCTFKTLIWADLFFAPTPTV